MSIEKKEALKELIYNYNNGLTTKGETPKAISKVGRPKLQHERRKYSTTLKPKTRRLCQEIIEKYKLNGWGYAIDDAIEEYANKRGIK